MPNWCENSLRIFGKGKEEILKKIFINDRLDFNTIVPMPAHQPDPSLPNPFYADGGLGSKEEEIFGRNNWYTWSCENWGTKWNAGETTLFNGVLYFDTAWSPPIPVIEALSKQFPKNSMTLRYKEEGMGFKGSIKYLDGKIISNIEK